MGDHRKETIKEPNSYQRRVVGNIVFKWVSLLNIFLFFFYNQVTHMITADIYDIQYTKVEFVP